MRAEKRVVRQTLLVSGVKLQYGSLYGNVSSPQSENTVGNMNVFYEFQMKRESRK